MREQSGGEQQGQETETQEAQLTKYLLTLLLDRIEISSHPLLFSSNIFRSGRPLACIPITVIQEVQSPHFDILVVDLGGVGIEIGFKVAEEVGGLGIRLPVPGGGAAHVAVVEP